MQSLTPMLAITEINEPNPTTKFRFTNIVSILKKKRCMSCMKVEIYKYPKNNLFIDAITKDSYGSKMSMYARTYPTNAPLNCRWCIAWLRFDPHYQ